MKDSKDNIIVFAEQWTQMCLRSSIANMQSLNRKNSQHFGWSNIVIIQVMKKNIME